jgi:cation diffusion facilitator family transporter
VNQRFQRSLGVTLTGLGVNAFLAAGKTLAGIFGHSQALIADGIESFADVLSSLVVWRGVVVAAAPADADHPYGHGKAEPIAAVTVSAMLVAAAFWIAVQAINQILVPHQCPAPWTLAVLIGVIAAKEWMFRFAHGQALELDSTVVRTDAWHHRSDAITSAAAFIGISVAVVGGKGYEAADDYAALIAAAIIAWNGLRLIGPALNELMDASPAPEWREDLREYAESTPGVSRVEKSLIRKMGGSYFVEMHVEVAPEMTVLRAHEISHQVKDRIRDKYPNVADVLVHIEPAGHRDA